MKARNRAKIQDRIALRIEQLEADQYVLRQHIDTMDESGERAKCIFADCELTGELRGLRDVLVAFENEGKELTHV